MLRWITLVGALAALLPAAPGCAAKVGGTWEVVEVKPHGASFPFNRVTFDEQGRFTSSGLYDEDGRLSDDVQTVTGRVERKGNNLRLVPSKGTVVAYKTRRRLDGKLVMTLRLPGRDRPLTAVLAPAD